MRGDILLFSPHRDLAHIKMSLANLRDFASCLLFPRDNVCSWQKADTLDALTKVRLWGLGGHCIRGCCPSTQGEEPMIRLIALTAQAAPLKRAGGCPPYYYRGAGGKCLHPTPEPYYGAERPDGYYASGYYWPYQPYKFSQP